MKIAAALLAVALTVPAASAATSGTAADGTKIRHLAGPKHVVLTPEQQAILDQANVHIDAGYALLTEKNQPGPAAEEFRKALALQRKLGLIVPETVTVGAGDFREEQGTAADKLETLGGIETMLEIAKSGGQLAADEYDYKGLHLRKIVKESKDVAKELETKQKDITKKMKELKAQAGAAGGKPDPDQQQDPQQDQQPTAAAAGGAQKPTPAGKPAAPGDKPAGQQPAGAAAAGAQAAAAKPGDKPTGAQPAGAAAGAKPEGQTAGAKPGEQTAGAQAAGAKPGAEPGAKPGDQPTGDAAAGAKPGDQAAGAKPGDQATGAKPDGDTATGAKPGDQAAGKPGDKATGEATDTAGAATAEGAKPDGTKPNAGKAGAAGAALADQQDAVAKGLRAQAQKMREERGDEATAAAFDAAADAAAQAAGKLRDGDVAGAEAAARDTERKIAAVNSGNEAAGAAGAQQAVASLSQRLGELQGRQDKVMARTRDLSQGGGGSPTARRDKATELMLEQGKVKGEVDAALSELKELAGSLGNDANAGNARSGQTAARDALAGAAKGLKDSKAPQQAVNAAMALKDGDLGAAAEAMAKVQAAIAEARGGVEAADHALTGGGAAMLRKDLASLQRISTELRGLEHAAETAAGARPDEQGGGEPGAKPGDKPGTDAGGKPGEGAGKPDQGLAANAKGDAAGKDPQAGAKPEPTAKPGGAAAGENQPASPGEGGAGEGKGTGTGGERGKSGMLSPNLGKAIDASEKKLRDQLEQTLARLQGVAPDEVARLRDLAKHDGEFEGDLDGSLQRVDRLVKQIEKLEGMIDRLIEKERDGAAARGFLKDPIPAAYQKAVAEYLRALAADEPGK